MNEDYGYEDYIDDDNEEATMIDSDNLDIIKDQENWVPTEYQILTYANHLGIDLNAFDKSRQIAIKNILLQSLKEPMQEGFERAFSKDGQTVWIINTVTSELFPDSELDEEARQKIEQFIELSEKEQQQNTNQLVPRKKIPPLGKKSINEDTFKQKEKEFWKNSNILNNEDKESELLKKRLKSNEDKKNKNNKNSSKSNQSSSDVRVLNNNESDKNYIDSSSDNEIVIHDNHRDDNVDYKNKNKKELNLNDTSNFSDSNVIIVDDKNHKSIFIILIVYRKKG